MASRNYDGTKKLQTNNVKSIRHTGDKVVVGNSDTDQVESRENDTDYRP